MRKGYIYMGKTLDLEAEPSLIKKRCLVEIAPPCLKMANTELKVKYSLPFMSLNYVDTDFILNIFLFRP